MTVPATPDSPPRPELLRDRLDHWAATRPDQPAITFDGRTFTWLQWHERVLRAACALRTAGIGAGDRICVIDLNHLATVELTLAASSIGAATVIGNFRLAADQIRHVLQDCRPAILFEGAQLRPLLDAAGAGELVPRRIVIGGDDDGYQPLLDTASPDKSSPDTSSPDTSSPDTAPLAGSSDRITPDDVCLILYTSGTTGRPKGAQLTHRNINAHSAAANAVFGLGTRDVNLVAMPLFHVGGTCYAQAGIHAGARTILVREPPAPSLFAAVAAGGTHAFLVPAVIHGVLAAGEAAIAALAPLRMLAYGAAPMPLPMLTRALAAWPQLHFVQVYGMTELSGATTMLTPQAHRDEAHPRRLVSAGTALPGVEVRIVDPVTCQELPAGAVGEIWFRSAQAMSGYLDQPEATAAVRTADGFIRSGDVGRMDADGFVYVVDRIKDMIITGGENVYTPEVENVLNACPDVAEGIVIGIPDQRWGESIRAVVVPAAGSSPDESAVIAFCRERLAHYQCPSSVEFVPELPRNGAGKVLKHQLREPFWRGRDRAI